MLASEQGVLKPASKVNYFCTVIKTSNQLSYICILINFNPTIICKETFLRCIILIISSLLLKKITNPSMIYHWIRSQSLFKLYMIKAVNEVLDRILKGYGALILDNFARSMKTNDIKDNI